MNDYGNIDNLVVETNPILKDNKIYLCNNVGAGEISITLDNRILKCEDIIEIKNNYILLKELDNTNNIKNIVVVYYKK